ncbi:cell division protein PerM [Nocardia africana]|uniref:Uncharacterized protein n=1 Tax=Nocardia africana TaxID=134964 RepID=A0A378X387_9NOCA|nr:DUF6350 family protein [Nocardia africana]MCC3317323.1 DUF6350 family protein [Nocardia africana]SUA48056.1 Uncharacterised protein [Nocardia africana]
MKSALVRWADLREQRAGARPAQARPHADAPHQRSGPGGADGSEDPVFLSLSPERAKVLLTIAARASSFTVVAIVAIVLVTLTAAGSGMTGASGAIAAGWLAVHQVPVVVGKTSLGLLPLLPTAVVLWLTMRDCAHAVSPRSSRADLGWIVGAALAGPLLVTAVCLAVAEDAATAVPLQSPHTLTAFCCVAGLHLLAAATGIATRPNALRDRIASSLPDWVFAGARAAARALWRLLLAGAVLTVVSFVLHWSVIGGTYETAGNFAGVVGLTALSLAYLPNVVIAATSVLIGADVHIGAGALSVFSVAGAPVPALPVLAAVPSGPAAGWWPIVLLIPAAVGVRGGLDCARDSADEMRSPWATVFSAALAALALLLLGLLAGGTVGSFGEIGPGVLVTAGLTFAWLTLAGYVGLLCGRRFLGIPPAVVEPGLGGRSGHRGRYLPTDYSRDEYDRNEDDHDEYRDRGYDPDFDRDDDYDDRDEPGYIDQLYDDPRYVEYEFEDDVAVEDDYPQPAYRRTRSVEVVEVDGELLDDDLAPAHADPDDEFDAGNSDIVDAEVVEGDLPESPGRGGR